MRIPVGDYRMSALPCTQCLNLYPAPTQRDYLGISVHTLNEQESVAVCTETRPLFVQRQRANAQVIDNPRVYTHLQMSI